MIIKVILAIYSVNYAFLLISCCENSPPAFLMENCDFLTTTSPSTPCPYPQTLTLFSGSYSKHGGWLIVNLSQFSTPPLQYDFAASPIKIPGLFPCSLKLDWPGDLLWPIEVSGDEAGPVLRLQEVLGASTHSGGTLQSMGTSLGLPAWGWETMWKRVQLLNWDHPRTEHWSLNMQESPV